MTGYTGVWWGLYVTLHILVQIIQLLEIKQGRGKKSRPTKAAFAKISSNLKC